MPPTKWIALVLACAAPAQAPAHAPLSSWAWRLDRQGAGPGGAFVVGNGRVVAVLGIEGPAHAVHGLRAAHDHDTAPAVAGARLELSVEGRAAGWSAHALHRLRRAAVCASEDREPGGLVLRARTFAPPAGDHLVQVVELHNPTARPRTALELRVETTGSARATLAGAEGGIFRIGDLAPGGVRRSVLTLASAGDPPELDPAAAEAAAESTLRQWRARLLGALRVASEPPRFADLADAGAVALLALRCSTCGGVAAGERSGALRLRDATGPLLAFLRLGLHDEARGLLRLPFAAARRLGRLPETLPADLDLRARVDGPDWNALQVPGGDLPSLVVLQHYWYWRAAGDLEPVRAHWPLLEACLKNAPRGPDGLPAGSYADAALLVQAVAALGALHEACGADGAAWERRSLELLHAMERRHWREEAGRFAPFVDSSDPIGEVNLLPLWSGQLAATGNRTRDNLRHSLARLWRRGARIGSSPADGSAPGWLQGMLVAALTQLEGRGRGAALDALLDMAEPAGAWGGHYGRDGRVAAEGRAPARLSTFATGVNLDAALFAVTGLRYATAPGLDEDWLRLRVQLPLGTKRVQLRGMAAEGLRLDLELTEERAPDAGRRLRFALTPRSLPPGPPQLAVVQCMGVQFQRYLRPDETVTESAAWRTEPERFLPKAGR